MRFKNYKSVLPDVDSRFPRCSHFPVFGGAVDETVNNIKAPQPMVVFSALGAISVAIQGLCDVKRPTGQVGPVSLFLLSLGKSGERKSTAENIFFEAIREFQIEQDNVWVNKNKDWVVVHDVWKSKRAALIKQISKKAVAGECSLSLESALLKLEKDQPEKPQKMKFVYEDSTSEALLSGLSEFNSAALISSENGLGSRAFNDLSKQNALWSGDAVTVDRKTSGSYQLTNARLTISFMTQPKTIDEYIRKRGDLARGAGLLSRFLVTAPDSTQGYRSIDNTTTSSECKYLFAERIKKLLSDNVSMMDDSARPRKVVKLSSKASERWVDAFNEIEIGIRSGGRFEGAGDLASKLADNIVRIAALLHVFEGYEGDVSLEVLEFAIDLCLWCSDEFYRVFMPLKEGEVEVVALRDWFLRRRAEGEGVLKKNVVLQYCPRLIKDVVQLNSALRKLEDSGEVIIFRERGALYVDFRCVRNNL